MMPASPSRPSSAPGGVPVLDRSSGDDPCGATHVLRAAGPRAASVKEPSMREYYTYFGLLELIRRLLVASPFAGRATARSGPAPPRARRPRQRQTGAAPAQAGACWRPSGSAAAAGPARTAARPSPSGPTSGGAPTRPWPGPAATGGCGCLPAWTTTLPRRGRTWPRSATGSPPSQPGYDAVVDRWGRLDADVARGVQLRHDWGPQYRSAHFAGSLAWLGISDDRAFLGEPEAGGCAERWVRTLKDQCLWAGLHEDVDELRQAVASFLRTYNAQWPIQRHGHRTPKEAYQAARSAPAA
jgi:Integrase core domain